MVVLEALARGVPVVGSALGGLPELIEPGSTGALVPANDPVALSAALAPFIADPAYGMSMRDRARQHVVTEFSPERHLERIDAAYREAGVPAAKDAAS
jgi:glycosyltransferase involved in cell wall biosynthesis